MTLEPNANWLALNDANRKLPIYAVNIDGAEDDSSPAQLIWYHDQPITSGATDAHYKYLRTITAVSDKYDPLRSEASVGGSTFELLKSAGIWNFQELFRAPVVIMAGYEGLDWDDFIEITPTVYIQNIQNAKGNTGFIFKCQDLQEQTNKTIFPSVTKASGTAESGTISTLVDSNRNEADDFWNGGSIKIIEGEGAGQTRTVEAFAQATGAFTTLSNWTTAPDSTSVYTVQNKLVASSTADSGTVNTLADATNRKEADDFWTGGSLTIFAGTGSGQVRTISDFVQSTGTFTVSANWSTTPDNTSTYSATVYHYSLRNPITLWLQIMTSIIGDTANGAYDVLPAGYGLGIDQSLVDVTECELIRDDFYIGKNAEWSFGSSFNAKDFFQEDIYRPFALAPVLKKNGKMSLRPILPPMPGYMQENGMGKAVTDAEILPLPGWKTAYRDIANQVVFSFDYDYITDEFESEVTYDDATSQAENGVRPMTLESKGIRTSNDGIAIAQIVANRYFQRYATLPSVVTIKTKFSQRIIEGADQLAITSDQIPNPDDGSFDWVARTAEVSQVTPDFKEGVINLVLTDISVGEFKYGIISPPGTVDFDSATALQKKTNCWIEEGYYII